GVSVDVSWWHLHQARYSATASLVPPGFRNGLDLADTFLTSPVFNFPIDFAGAARQLPTGLGNSLTTFGIWNAASLMTIDFVQRADQVELTGRIPVFENDCFRTYGLIGPRFVWFWERFHWRTVDVDAFGLAVGNDAADYSNVLSQRMYGGFLGCGNECW